MLKQAFALQGKQAPPEVPPVKQVPPPLKSIVRGARMRKGQSGAGGSWKQAPADDGKAKRKGRVRAGVGGGAVDYSVPTIMTPPDLGTQERVVSALLSSLSDVSSLLSSLSESYRLCGESACVCLLSCLLVSIAVRN